jgi:hypothetical protein
MTSPAEQDRERRAELELALKELLVGEHRVRIDPTTGQVIDDTGKSSLTDSERGPTIP